MQQAIRTWGAATATLTLGILLFGNANGAAKPAHRLAPAAQAPSATGTWEIDPAHSNVNFAIRHMGISTVRGRFDEVAGTVTADAANPTKSSVQVTIQTASIDTDIKMRDDHLRGPDFFDVEKYPTITFKSTRVEKRKDGFIAHGLLTMHGVSKAIALPFKASGPVKDPRSGSRAGVEAQVRLNRQDFGLRYHEVLDNGALALANDVDVIISLEAVPAKTAPAAP